jgi:hypothetical protein
MIYAAVGLIGYLLLNYTRIVDPVMSLAQNKDVNGSVLLSVILVPVGILAFSLLTFFLGYRLLASSGVTTDAALPQ